jgi:hypothetical protein
VAARFSTRFFSLATFEAHSWSSISFARLVSSTVIFSLRLEAPHPMAAALGAGFISGRTA